MSPRLIDFIDPWACAQAGRRYDGEVPLEKFTRLCEGLVDQSGAVQVEFACRKDERRRTRIAGRIRASLRLQCQRCLDPFELLVEQEFDVVVVATAAEAEALPEELDPLIVEDGRLRVQDLVEDELLLALPLIPRHEGHCGPDLPSPEPDMETATEAVNPLAAALAGLKRSH